MSANTVSVDEETLRKDIKNLVRKTVEETLNTQLDEEASEFVGAERYESMAGQEAYRSGYYARKLVTGAGEVELSVPKLGVATFHTADIERYRRRETSVEEAIVEMYLAGVSTRRIEDVSSSSGGAGVFRHRLQPQREGLRIHRGMAAEAARGRLPYVFVDGIYLKRSWGGSYENVAVPVAIGVNSADDRKVIGCSEGHTESAKVWREFFSRLRGRGLSGVQPVTGDKCAGGCSVRSRRCSPGPATRPSTVHFYRNVLGRVAVTGWKAAARILKAIHAQESREAVRKGGGLEEDGAENG